ncbi:DUF2299 family protein [Candidatus Nitrosocosmicus sp. R]
MTDENREFIFNNITRWLRDSNFVISEEKITVVTSEFYAKAHLQSDHEHILEIISSSGIEARFVLRTRLQVSEQQLAVIEKLGPKEKRTFNDKMNNIIIAQHQSIIFRDKSAALEKIISIDPKSIDSKQEVIQNVSSLLESAKKLDIIFNEFF